MALYAIDALDDSLSATREFLFTPPSLRRWLVLSVVVFFLGGGTGGGYGTSTTNILSERPSGRELEPIFDTAIEWITANLGLVLVAIGIVLAVGAFFWFIAALMEIVFIESLRTDQVRVIRFSERYFWKAVRLFVFRTAIAAVTLTIVLLVGYVALSGITSGDTPPVGLVVGSLLIGVLAVVAYALVDGFTTAFVVPVMLVKECGVIAGWRAFWRTFVRSWTQYLAYVVAVFFLRFGIGIVVSIATGAIALVLLLPLAPPAILVYFTVGTGPLGLLLIGLIAVAYIGLVFLGTLLIRIPVESYFRYYAMFVLGDTNAELDPIPAIRTAVRNRRPPDLPTESGT